MLFRSLGGPNFAQLPINRPLAEVRTNQHDGYGQHAIPQGRSSYYKNTIGGGCPALADENVFRHYTQRLDGQTMRKRAESFENHYSQARMFWTSMSPVEAEHIVAAFAFELGKVEVPEIRSAVVAQLARVDGSLAAQVAAKLGLPAPPEEPVDDAVPSSPALSQITDAGDTIESRKVAVLAADGVDVTGTQRFIELMEQRGAVVEVLAPVAGGTLEGGSGGELAVDRSFTTMASVLYDAVVVACGPRSISTLSDDGYAVHFVTEAYKHLKPIGAYGAGVDLLRTAGITNRLAEDTDVLNDQSVITTTAAADEFPDRFVEELAAALAQHRCWQRRTDPVPA